jgi:heparosan-N-sulfate-glucuronate 5-epimerase
MRLVAKLLRTPQRRAPFLAGDPASGYYNDLSVEVTAHAPTPSEGHSRLAELTRDRGRANMVSIAQLGLGAWQLSLDHEGWTEVARSAADWLRGELEPNGVLLNHFAMPHTFPLDAPWASAMAQGQAASLFVRLGSVDPMYQSAALTAVRPLVLETSPLLVRTEEGPVLQEYPTSPPSHVLNGWIFALWGLYDVASTDQTAPDDELVDTARDAFRSGVNALAARLVLYELAGGWTRYDLYPHPIAHPASPFYHRLHVEQLHAMSELVDEPAFTEVAARWERAADRRAVVAGAVARKAAFRVLRPRRRVS